MLSITFDFRTNSVDDPMVQQALKLSREFMNCTGPMSNLVDFIPLLQVLPLPLHSRAKALHNGLVETYGGLIKDTGKKLQWGVQVNDCLAKSMLEVKEEEGLDDLDMAILASAFMIGGVETVSALIFSPPYDTITKPSIDRLDYAVVFSAHPGISRNPAPRLARARRSRWS